MKNEKKLDNKGFSLVELIIVIAIMAVLIGVLAPQYMRYVERGRAAADRDNVEAVVNAIQVWAVDPQGAGINGHTAFADGNSITLTRTGTVTATGAINDALVAAGVGTITGTPAASTLPALTNAQTFPSVTITVHINGTGDNRTFSVDAVEATAP